MKHKNPYDLSKQQPYKKKKKNNMIIIEPEFILIHLLKNKNSTTIKKLVNIKRKIEKKFPFIYVDVTKFNIISTIQYYSDIFLYENEKIYKKEIAKEYFENSFKYFDIKLNEKTKKIIIKIINKNGK